MAFNEDDLFLKKLCAGATLKKTPVEILDNFEAGVYKKIHRAAWMPWLAGAGVVVVLSLALGYGIMHRPAGNMLMPMHSEPSPDIKYEGVQDMETPLVENTIVKKSEPLMEEIAETVSRDILLLQMLGEDDDFVSELDLMDADLDMLSAISPVTAA